MRTSQGASLSHRFQVRFEAGCHAELLARASASSLSVAALVRHLVERSLAADRSVATRLADNERDIVGLAALVAAEHTLRLLELAVPDGARRSTVLRADALAAAEARLDELQLRINEEATQ